MARLPATEPKMGPSTSPSRSQKIKIRGREDYREQGHDACHLFTGACRSFPFPGPSATFEKTTQLSTMFNPRKTAPCFVSLQQVVMLCARKHFHTLSNSNMGTHYIFKMQMIRYSVDGQPCLNPNCPGTLRAINPVYSPIRDAHNFRTVCDQCKQPGNH
eukprot:g68112.t1